MRKLEQIIETQIQQWSQQRAEADRQAEPLGAWPLITISRQFGARGAALAGLLGAHTGFAVWDKRLMHAIAEESGYDEALLATLDEHRRRAIDDAVEGLMMRGTNVAYLRALLRVLRTIALHGRAIIVGRGANYAVPPERTLRVRVVAPLEVRVQNYAEREGLAPSEARKHIVEMDAVRADFVRHHFHRDIEATDDYDLVLNADAFSLEKQVALVAQACEAKMGRRLVAVPA